MPKLLDQEAWVADESGERFEEYDTEVDGNVVTCYIASEAGKIFSLHWQRHECSEQTACTAEFYVDGIYIDGIIAKKNDCGEFFSGGHYQDESRYRPYKFANILLSDEDEEELNEELGTISILSNRVVVTGTNKKSFEPSTLPHDFTKAVNEKTKKLGCHRVGLDDEEKKIGTVGGPRYNTKPYRGEAGPHIGFNFIYRPKDILRALGLLPLSQSKENERPISISPSPDSESVRENGVQEKKKKRKAEKRKRDEDKETSDLLAQEAELTRKLEEIRKRKKGLTKVKKEVKQEDHGHAGFQLDKNGAIDLTLDD